MNELIAIAYPDEQRAGRILQSLNEQQSSYVIDLNDAVSVTKGVDGKVKLRQSTSLTVVWALLGLFLGPSSG